MKNTCFTLFFFFAYIISTHAQSILPGLKTYRHNIVKKIERDSAYAFPKGVESEGHQFYVTKRNLVSHIDSASAKKINDSLLTLEVDTLNQSSNVSIIATSGLNNLENIQKSYGNLGVGLQFRLTKYKLTKKNWIDPHFLYVIFNAKTASSPDSSSIQKTFLFPELNKRDFVLGYFWEFRKNGWSIAPSFEFSLNRYTDSGGSKLFLSQSFNLGIKVQKSFDSTAGFNLPSCIQMFPYFSLINVDPKYSSIYQSLTGEPNIPSTFYALGLITSVHIPHLTLFCDMKYVLNKSNGITSPDLIRFVYTIGTMFSL